MLNGGMGGKEGKVKLTTNFPSSRAAYVAISTSNFILALVSYLHQPASRTHAHTRMFCGGGCLRIDVGYVDLF